MADPQLTEEQWRDILDGQLEARRSKIERYQRYYDGKHRLAFATTKFREAFGNLFGAFADNWCQLIVDAPVERLEVQGFRFGDETSDDDAWSIWQANGLDAASVIAHTEAGKCGESYALVSPSDAKPLITIEHPLQVVVASSASNRRVRLAAWKKWLDDSGYVFGTLYTPDYIVKWRSQAKATSSADLNSSTWVFRDDADPGTKNPLGVVPVVPLSNNPQMLTGGRSDLETVIPMQDALNKLVTDMMVASEFSAFRQRVASGLEVPEGMTPEEFRDKFVSAVSRLWIVGDENVKWSEFEATDLGNYVHAIELIVQHIAAQTRTPPHYLLGQVVNLSADALKAAETGLVGKVRRRQIDYGESWEDVMRLAFLAAGETAKANDTDAETLWRDPESRTEAQKADAAVKMQSIGVPWETIMEYLGYSPQKIARMRSQRVQDALLASISAPPPVPGVQPGPVPPVPAPQPLPGPPGPMPPVPAR